MIKQNKVKGLIIIAIALAILAISYFIVGLTGFVVQDDTIKIGVITDLSGPVAYWGESTRVGAELAAEELKAEGYNVELIFEDYQLDPKQATNAAQKLVNIDGVDAIYAEFNPAAFSVGSFVQNKEILYFYVSAMVSPLENNPNAYKTYLDYKEGCKLVAEKFKNEGTEKVGVLKINLETGDLCLSGVKEVYGENTFVESFNLGDQDFRTQFLKLKQNNVQAVIGVMFEGDTLNALKVIKEQNLGMKYGTVDDSITEQVTVAYSKELEDSWSFGFQEIDADFKNKLSEYNLATDYGAAIAYTHVKQIVKVLADCNNNLECATEKMDSMPADNTIGFEGFNNHIAELNMQIKGR